MLEFYLNADFDLSLRGSRSLLEGEDATYLHEMANHFLFAGSPDDSVLLHAPLSPDFLSYLATKELSLPKTPIHPEFTPEAKFTPFGWNSLTDSLNRRYSRPAVHPDLDIVRKANARDFSHALEARDEGASLDLFETLPELEAFQRDHPSPNGWMAKGNHGHAGTANLRLASGPIEAEARRVLELLIQESGKVSLELWQDRVEDMALLFDVDEGGKASNARGHSILNSRDGSFLGVLVRPDGKAPPAWHPKLVDAVGPLAEALHALGYHGQVGLDAYAWQDGEGTIRLRPYVDINARLSMALPAHGLAARIPGRWIQWTWAKPKKLRMPSDYAALKENLGEAEYNPKHGSGILIASPLRIEARHRGAPTRPKRLSIALVARDEAELDSLRARCQAALGRA